MRQRAPAPYLDASRGRFLVESMTSGSVALLGARDRNDQIELRACIDHPADAAKNAIHFSKCSETIDVNWCETRGLREQVFVCHESPGDYCVSQRAASWVHNYTQCKTHLGHNHRYFFSVELRESRPNTRNRAQGEAT